MPLDRSSDHRRRRLLSGLLSFSLSLSRVVVREGKFEGFARSDMPKPSSSSAAWVPLLRSPFLSLPRERNVRISGGGTSGQHISEQVSSFSSFGVSLFFFRFLSGACRNSASHWGSCCYRLLSRNVFFYLRRVQERFCVILPGAD